MKQFSVILACIVLLCLISSCAEDPPQAPQTPDAVSLAKGGRPGGGETAVNNLSFPVLAMDGFAISAIVSKFTVPYTGDYPGLTSTEIAWLLANGYVDETGVYVGWYPQKNPGNAWQAAYATPTEPVVASWINWGDNIESNDPKLRRPFRLEVSLFKDLDIPMTAYTMAVLEYPSSANELQGTNKGTYASYQASIISGLPKLVVQYLGDSEPPAGLVWDVNVNKWTLDGSVVTLVPVSFGTELNVGGKYIWGASQGGWKPDKVGYYRLTFYIPAASNIDFVVGQTGIYVTPSEEIIAEAETGGGAEPVIDYENNLTYADVHVVSGGGGSGGRP